MVPASIKGKYIIRFTVTSQYTTEADIERDWKIIKDTYMKMCRAESEPYEVRVGLILSYLLRMDFPILIIWMTPLLFLGASGVIFHFLFHFSIKFMQANIITPDGTPHFVASHLGILCLPMSHKKDARLILVKCF